MMPILDTPDELKEQCLRCLSQHPKLLRGYKLPRELCEQFLFYYHFYRKPIDTEITHLFSSPLTTPVRRLYLRHSKISDTALERFLKHGLTHLDISKCPKLSYPTLENISRHGSRLEELILGNFESLMKNCPYSSVELILPNLRRLEITNFIFSKNDFVPQNAFYIFMKHLRKLTHLSLLSPTEHLGDISYLKCLHLTSLMLHKIHLRSNLLDTLISIPSLVHLDISATGGPEGDYEFPNETLAKIVEALPRLKSLDISGTNLAGRGVASEDYLGKSNVTDIVGLRSRADRPFEFLGLYDTKHEACRRHHIPALEISGDADEKQIITAARRYADRQEILAKVLNDVYNLCRIEACTNLDTVLDVILDAMNKHRTEKLIQICGSATLFYIVKGKDRNHFSMKVRRKIIFSLLNGMFTFRKDDFMLRNGCLTLCQFKIPHDVMFEYERLVEILLITVKEMREQIFIQRISIYLLNSLACQVDGYHKHLLGDAGVVKIMLDLIKERLSRRECDDVMEVAWSALWNVTDETAVNCARFLDLDGMESFLECLAAFPEKEELLRNMMGLLGNVAEVNSLRPSLMTEDFVSVFARLLESDSDGIEVSYNAAGVLAHMCSDGPDAWTIKRPSRESVLLKMEKAINRWDLMTERNINYRSFEPILGLLSATHTPQCQHWAVWALANLTTVYPNKYCSLVESEGGLDKLTCFEILNFDVSAYPIRRLAATVIDNCQRFKQKNYQGIKLDG